jgi:hypothetical protein
LIADWDARIPIEELKKIHHTSKETISILAEQGVLKPRIQRRQKKNKFIYEVLASNPEKEDNSNATKIPESTHAEGSLLPA